MGSAANENKAGASAEAAAGVKAKNPPVPKYFRKKGRERHPAQEEGGQGHRAAHFGEEASPWQDG